MLVRKVLVLHSSCCSMPSLTHLADPFLNDQNYVLSMLTLEELGATGNKVCTQPHAPCSYWMADQQL